MKVPLSWLKEFVEITLPVEELARRLTLSGMEVSAIDYIGVEGADLPWDPAKIVIANILEVKPHPNADRLVLADVDVGGTQPHTVVTGAPNLFPYKGQGPLSHPLKAVFAREGSRLYDGHQADRVVITLKGRPVRGVMSDAMLCSEKELGISDEHEGILILEADAPVGMPLRDFLGDVVLELEFTPNYARCLSMVGMAREVAAITGTPLRLPDPQVVMDGPAIAGRAHVTVEAPDLCPRFTLSLVEGVRMGESPAWMQRRLRLAGMRPVNVIVDISNYVLLEWGAPSHAFDADHVQDRHLVVRLAQPGEHLITLDSKDRDLTGGTPPLAAPPLLVCDPASGLGIAGVMGGESSEVRDTTTNVLLELAIWEPTQIRRVAQHFKLFSEASRRFERGVDYEVVLLAQRRALELIRTLAGGTVAQGIVDVYSRPWQPIVLDLTATEVTRIVGITLSAETICALLERLGFGCTIHPDHHDFVRVQVPSSRLDVSILADLCEEVARIYGYDQVPPTLLSDVLPQGQPHPDQDLEQHIRDMMAGCGLDEVITYSLTSMPAVARVQPSEAVPERYLKLTNPSTPEREYLRRSILPTLLEALVLNVREQVSAQIFEIGRVILPLSRPGSDGEWLPMEPLRLAIALAGTREPAGWQTGNSEPVDFFDLKGMIETLLTRLRLDDQIAYLPLTDDERFHPGRAARLVMAESHAPIGVFGEMHPDMIERLELPLSRALAAELDLESLIAMARPPRYAPISRYPATVQDLAVVASCTVPATRVAEVIRRAAGDLLEDLSLFDIYTGSQVGEGHRSLAYRLRFRASDRTLSDDALAKVRAKIVKLLERELGVKLRG